MSGEKTIVTSNGIKIHSYKVPTSHSFYLSLYLRVGSMYESSEESGITHFLEHALIRNVNSMMDGKLYTVLDQNGIAFNASTYSEMVQFYITGAPDSFRTCAEILTRLFSPIRLSSSEIRIERERIKAEIRESDDKSSLTSFSGGIVHDGTSLSRSILGTLGSVSRIGCTVLEGYRRRAFVADNLFVYLTGAFDDSDLATLSELLGGVELYEGEIHDNTAPVSRNFGKREPKIYVKNADFTMVRFSFDMDMSRIKAGVDDLIYDILLEGYSSPFFIEMSEKRGLFYDLTGGVEKYRNIGTFFFSFEVRSDKVVDSLRQALKVLSDFKSRTLSEEECMKASYTRNGMMLCDDVRDLNFTLAYDSHILDAPYRTVEERVRWYDAITPEMIREAAEIIFAPENMVVAVKGNKRKLDIPALESLICGYHKGLL